MLDQIRFEIRSKLNLKINQLYNQIYRSVELNWVCCDWKKLNIIQLTSMYTVAASMEY